MRLKSGVNPIGIRPEMLLAIMVADAAYTRFGFECVVTSINDSDHAKTSRHYQGMAADFRISHLPTGPPGYAVGISDEIQLDLGLNYFVLLESNHIHVSYKPRKP